MRDILADLHRCWQSGQPAALATVLGVWKSAPRQPGASMVVAGDGAVAGSVSGGCVEGAVYELGMEVLRSRRPERVRFGVSDDDALTVGLTCGGQIEILVQPFDRETFPFFDLVVQSIETEEAVCIAVPVEAAEGIGPMAVWSDQTRGSLGSPEIDEAVTRDARGMLHVGENETRSYGACGEPAGDEMEVFFLSFAPRPRLLVFGAIDFAEALVRMGNFLGYHVTVCDARRAFVTRQRFPSADEVVVEWPHRYLQDTDIDQRTAICVLTHDPKFDVPLLEVALRTDVGYIGAMGSRRTHEDRLRRLRERGLSEKELARLRSPIGLDIGGRTSAETAVSIAAEIIQQRWQGSGLPLTDTHGRIHAERPTAGSYVDSGLTQ